MPATLAPLQPPRRLLFGPGPTMVDPRVYAAMAKPIVGHLDPYFFSVVEDIRGLLSAAFGTANPFTMALSGTGSAGMEAAVSNFVEPGQRMAVLANGYFCERLAEMGRRYGAEVVRLDKPWGEGFSDDAAASFIHEQRPHVVAYVHAETSTGYCQRGQAICEAARAVDALTIADCVTSLGAMPVGVDEIGIDIAYSCSQKGMSCPPGLAPITVAPRAMERLRARKDSSRSWYLDLRLLDDYYDGAHRYHHTAPITLFYGLREGLAVIAEEGLETRWERHRRQHQAFVAGVEAMGLVMHVSPANRIWNLNTPRVPEGVDDLKVRQRLVASHGIEIMGGFGPLAGKVFRVGVMGPLANPESLLLLLGAFEDALRAEGYAPRASATEAARAVPA